MVTALIALEGADMTIDEASHLWFINHLKLAESRHVEIICQALRNDGVFSEEQCLAIIFNNIVRNAAGMLAMLCRHIDLDANRVNEAVWAELAIPLSAGRGYDLLEPCQNFYGSYMRRRLGRNRSRWCASITLARLGRRTRSG